ncbi:MAG: DUF1573 domain-containing protein [Candidatus Uhrbacteria bacterium]|nr:DUF1573 domain-containing protein [Candidatus Uhrbacteria bacterium]
MKSLLILVTLLGVGILAIVLWPAAPAQIGASPASVNFGDVDQGGGPVTTTVEIRNDGGKPLNIFRVSTSCGCTTAQMDAEPIEPGASRSLTITFDPMVHPDENGSITRVVYIQSSDPQQPELVIDVIGNVIPVKPL